MHKKIILTYNPTIRFSKYVIIFILLIEVVAFWWALNFSQIKIIIIIKLCDIKS